MYGLNPLVSNKFLPLPQKDVATIDAEQHAKDMKALHDKIQAHIEKQNELYRKNEN